MVTGGDRPRSEELPTRFHIGTPRAASSFLFNLLKSHPDVSLAPVQDVNFYSLNYERGFDWYRESFPTAGVRIDTSPTYFRLFDVAAPRIKAAVGSEAPRFLLVLRNPIDYARSHFQMQLRQGAFEREPDEYPVVPSSFLEFARRYDGWLGPARYADLLERVCFAHFDRSQFEIVLFEDLVADSERVGNEILAFFGLPPQRLATVPLSQNRTLRHPALYRLRRGLNRGPRGLKRFVKRRRVFNALYTNWMVQKTPKELPAADRAGVAELLADDVANLKRLLGREIPQWKDFA